MIALYRIKVSQTSSQFYFKSSFDPNLSHIIQANLNITDACTKTFINFACKIFNNKLKNVL